MAQWGERQVTAGRVSSPGILVVSKCGMVDGPEFEEAVELAMAIAYALAIEIALEAAVDIAIEIAKPPVK